MIKYYSSYKNDLKTITHSKVLKPDKKKKVIRGVYDIETNNEKAKFIVGGLALNNNHDTGETDKDYNITFVNKPILVLQVIYQHAREMDCKRRYEIAVHNLAFDIQSLMYNLLEDSGIVYKEPDEHGKQERNTYSIIMNNRKQIFSCTINYAGIDIMFWDTLKLYPAPLKKLCEVYQLKNYKLEAGEETYNSDSFIDFCNNKTNVDYLINDLLSVAELIDRDYYKKKTASSNAWDNMQKDICETLGCKRRGDNEIKKIIEFWGDNDINDYCLPGYSGGFCFANPNHTSEILYSVIHLDINSSYPNAMAHLDLPLTHKTSKQIECDRYLIFVKGDFRLKPNTFPVIKHPFFMNQYLGHYKGDLLLTDIEWKRIQKNYDITGLKIIEVMNFPKCDKVLKSFVEKNYEMKQNSTGFLREKAKLNLNSAYGKLAEHHNGQYYRAYIDEHTNTVGFQISDDTINLIDTEKSRCTIWAMFITAFAREKLYRCMDILGDDFIYTDTDSIFTTLSEEEVRKRFAEIGEEIDDKKLGAWAIEGHSPIFKAIRAKCYLKTDEDKDGVHRLNYVVAGYNGKDLVNGKVNEPIRYIDTKELKEIFDNFKIGRVVYDKETSVMREFGIKQVKVLSEFEIKEKVNNFEFVDFRKVGEKDEK